jgi:hypothetical protein
MMTMSNIEIENRMECIITEVDTLWQVKDRDDLKDDCIQYVFKNWESGFKDVIYLVIAFLSNKCADALSTADLREMAAIDNMQYEDGIKPERHGFLTYEEATQGK